MALYSKEGVNNIHLVDPTPGLIEHPPDPSCINASYNDTKPIAAAINSSTPNGQIIIQSIETDNGHNNAKLDNNKPVHIKQKDNDNENNLDSTISC